MNKKIILASASPRRRELLTQIGLDFDVVVSETEEKITSTEPAKVVEELSAQKAEAVWEKLAVSGVCQAPDNSADRMHEGCGVCDPEQKDRLRISVLQPDFENIGTEERRTAHDVCP